MELPSTKMQKTVGGAKILFLMRQGRVEQKFSIGHGDFEMSLSGEVA